MSEITEFEWYLRDQLFRQSNQGRQKFQKQEIAKEMSNLYLRYKNADLEKLNKLTNILGMAGLEYFTITTPDTSTINTIKSIMDDSVTSERQEKQLQDENNENQILIKDPDGIQILIKSVSV